MAKKQSFVSEDVIYAPKSELCFGVHNINNFWTAMKIPRLKSLQKIFLETTQL